MEGCDKGNNDGFRTPALDGEPVGLQAADVRRDEEESSPVTGVLHLKVNGCEGRYDGDCCKDDPFCDKHCDLDEDVFYVMKIKRSGMATAEFCGAGVVFHDAWSIGRLGSSGDVSFRGSVRSRVGEWQHAEGSQDCRSISPSFLFGAAGLSCPPPSCKSVSTVEEGDVDNTVEDSFKDIFKVLMNVGQEDVACN